MYHHLTSWDNLLLAYRKASKGKRGHANVAAFEHRLEDNLQDLRSELRAQTYRPGPYTSFTIHEPKRRLISAAPFRDRVVHHALCNLIEPIFERSFIADSYANRVGKGTHRALDRCQYFARRYRYVLQCDIQQFFPAIDHTVLRATLTKKIEDVQVMWLVDQIMASGKGVLTEQYDMVYFPSDDLFAVNLSRGLPTGNLTIHPGAHPRPVSEGIPFLGFIVYPHQRRLKRRKGVYYRRKLRRLVDAYNRGELSFEDVDASVQGWINHVSYGNTVGLRKVLFRSVPLQPPKEYRG